MGPIVGLESVLARLSSTAGHNHAAPWAIEGHTVSKLPPSRSDQSRWAAPKAARHPLNICIATAQLYALQTTSSDTHTYTPFDERVTPASTELATEQIGSESSVCRSRALPAGSSALGVLCAKLLALNASVGEARLGGCCLDVWTGK
jgi:hypothetical protein